MMCVTKGNQLKLTLIFMLLICSLFSFTISASESMIYKQADVHPNNYGSRSGEIPTLLHIFYTGESLQDALDTFNNPKEKVSVHYLISEEGSIYRLVLESESAFHAGQSHWGNIKAINEHSIGIALVNQGISDEQAMKTGWKNNFPKYSQKQIDALVLLSKDIIKRFNIQPWNIVGHSDVAPQRKFDPGLSFPWEYLAKKGVGIWPEKIRNNPQAVVNKLEFLEKLASYGYDLPKYRLEPNKSETDPTIKNVISAFQAHFRPTQVDGMIDLETQCILNELLAIKSKE